MSGRDRVATRRAECHVITSGGLRFATPPLRWASPLLEGAPHGSISCGVHGVQASLVNHVCCLRTSGQQQPHSMRVALRSRARRVR